MFKCMVMLLGFFLLVVSLCDASNSSGVEQKMNHLQNEKSPYLL